MDMSKMRKEELKQRLLEGATELSEYVGTTLGPYGRTVLISDEKGGVVATKDGNTVASVFSTEDPVRKMAVSIIRQATQKTNDQAGDGTTTTTVLASAFFRELNRQELLGTNILQLRSEMENVAEICAREVDGIATEVHSENDIHSVAMLSANGDEGIATIIKESVDKAGFYGSILIEDSKTADTFVEYKEGFKFDTGYVTEKFATNRDRMSIEYENCWVMVTDQRFGSNPKDVLPLEWAVKDNRPLIIIADDFDLDGPGFGNCLGNFLKGKVKVALIRAPRFGEEKRNILEDLCVATGATLISRVNGMNIADTRPEQFGNCDRCEITRYSTTLAGLGGEPTLIEQRIAGITSQIAETDVVGETNRLSERIARLSAGVVVIKVGGNTRAELVEKKHRIEDALGAVKCTLLEGYVTGGTLTYFKLLRKLENLSKRENGISRETLAVVRHGFNSLLENLCRNGKFSADFAKEKMRPEKDFGLNFRTGRFENLLSAGIIEPAILVKSVIRNSITAALILFYSDAAIQVS